MKEVRIAPSPNMELCVRISEQMERDFQRCIELSAEIEDGPDCDTCSWRNLVLENGSQSIAACTFPKVRKVMEETV